MKILKKHVLWYMERFREDRLDSTAAHVAYFIIISFIPFATFLLTLFQEIHFSGTTLIREMLRIFPETVAQYLEGLLAQSAPASSVLSVSIVTFLWSASSGMVTIIKGLDVIYGVKETRSFLRLRLLSMLYLVAFALVLIITAVTLVFGSSVFQYVLGKVPPLLGSFLLSFKSLFGFIFLILFFCLIFNAIPRKKAKFLHNLIGAVFSAAGWVLFSFFFSIFVDNFANFSIYGGLATLVILMFWLYTCMYIMFIGAEIAVWLEQMPVTEDFKLLLVESKEKKKKKKAKKEISSTSTTKTSPQKNAKPLEDEK